MPNTVSPDAVTFTAANIPQLNGIKTSIATAASVATYTGAALNGASATPLPDSKTGFAQWPAATASSSAGSYVDGSTIVFTGTYHGAAVTRTATVVGTGGNATFIADGPVDGAITSIVVAAQTNTSGAWTFGFVDLECPVTSIGDGKFKRRPWTKARGSTAANIGFYRKSGAADYLPCIAGESHSVEISRLKTSTTTVTLVTLYE
jgi:hypothetical protein